MKERTYQIVQILLQVDDFITIDEIASQVKASNKTVRNDMVEIQDFLQENNLELFKRPGSGVKIEGLQKHKLFLLNQYAQHLNVLEQYTPEARKIVLSLMLLTQESIYYTVTELADKLYVSRATLNKDLNQVDTLLNSFKVRLNRNQLQISGREKNIRNALVHCLKASNGYTQFSEMIRNQNTKLSNKKLFDGLELTDYQIQAFIQSVNMEDLASEFPAAIRLMTQLFANWIRLRIHKEVELSDEFIEELQGEPGYQEAKRLLQGLPELNDVSETENRYLQVYLFSGQHHQDIKSSDQHLAQTISNDLIDQWSKDLNIDLRQAPALYTDLIEHLCPAMTRFRHAISVDNPLLIQIEHNYPQEFKVVMKSKDIINNHFETPVSQNELSYLTIHLVNALNTLKQPLKVILVNNTGVGTSKLLSQSLQSYIPEIELLKTIDYTQFSEKQTLEAELIISTLPLNLKSHKAVIVIDSILSADNLARLRQLLFESYKEKNKATLL